MKKYLKIILIVAVILTMAVVGIKTFSNEDDWICANGEWIAHGKPSAPKPISFCEKSCTLDSECETPGEFLMQSNCPFASVCVENKCRVICPIDFGKENVANCSTKNDCDCSWRGARTIQCICLEGNCASVEA
jgi:hypothetical protein